MQRVLNGEVVRALREARGISLRALARDIGRDPATISRIERGINQPSAVVMLAIAERLSVSVETITHFVRDAA